MLVKPVKYLILVCISLTLFACGKGGNSSVKVSVNQKIIDGAEQNTFLSPQILRIDMVFPDSSSGYCTGTVIGVNSILTAGHCFSGGVSAAYITRPDGSIVGISEAYIHPEYSVNMSLNAIFNDVAIVKTSEPLNLPVLGILTSREIPTPAIVGIYGYGLDEDGQQGTLRTGTMEVTTITANHLIATFDGLSNTCNGDSGGPVTYSAENPDGSLAFVAIAGITSSGSLDDCSEGDVNLFTNLNNPSIISFISGLVPEVALQ